MVHFPVVFLSLIMLLMALVSIIVLGNRKYSNLQRDFRLNAWLVVSVSVIDTLVWYSVYRTTMLVIGILYIFLELVQLSMYLLAKEHSYKRSLLHLSLCVTYNLLYILVWFIHTKKKIAMASTMIRKILMLEAVLLDVICPFKC